MMAKKLLINNLLLVARCCLKSQQTIIWSVMETCLIHICIYCLSWDRFVHVYK